MIEVLRSRKLDRDACLNMADDLGSRAAERDGRADRRPLLDLDGYQHALPMLSASLPLSTNEA